MIRVGIVGFGFMGQMHMQCYNANDMAEVAAICDADESRLKGESGTVGNVAGTEEPLDLSGIELFTDFNSMIDEAELDAISITLPTHMHRDFTVKALEAGFNVLCEKPMAINQAQCEDMIAAAEKSGKILQIGHCIRFWPEYARTKQLIESGDYGEVVAASFRRLSATPKWSWGNWLMGGAKSGGALMDLHIHDADFVQYLFGMPRAVYTQGIKGPSSDFDHVLTQYVYDDEKAVAAEGGWVMMPGFGFEMSFNIMLERATIVFDVNRDPSFKLFDGEAEEAVIPEVVEGDGYLLEIAHFLKSVSGEKVPDIITPTQSLNSVKLVLAEKRSAETRSVVYLP
ncbi:Gfo/Idh/MocA family protein [Candidatus Poribacteria bacterium]